MKRSILIILAGGLVLIAVAGLFLIKRSNTAPSSEQELNEVKDLPQEIQEEKQAAVPLPTGEDIVRFFLNLLMKKEFLRQLR